MKKICLLVPYIAFTAILLAGPLVVGVYGLAESTGPEGSNARVLYNLGKTGSGIKVGILGGQNVKEDHEAFENIYVENSSQTGYPLNVDGHDTMLAGIIASGGWTGYTDDIGVAPGVSIYSFRVVTIPNGMVEGLGWLINTKGCRVVTTGFHLPEPDFPDTVTDPRTAEYDYYAYEHNVVFASAAGNEQTGQTIVSCPGDAYNGITTAGIVLNDSSNEHIYRLIGSISLSGPTEDGIRKPDIAAPSNAQTVPYDTSATWNNTSGGGATSWSAPHTAGVAAILLSHADSTTAEPYDDENEVIKAVIVNSACPNINDKANQPTTGQVFNYDRGYGRIDAMRAYQTLSAPRLLESSTTTNLMGWAFENIPKRVTHTFTVYAEENEHLAVTLTWNRLVAKDGSDYIPESSCIDLDLEVRDNSTGVPVFTQSDSVNNLEKCDILIPQTGYYDIEVSNRDNQKSRDYGMAFEVIEPVFCDFDLNYIVDYNDLDSMLLKWLEDATGLEIDLYIDGTIDLRDLNILAENWYNFDKSYYEY